MENLKPYTYNGSTPAHATLPEIGEVSMHSGEVYELPENNNYVVSLVKQGYLTEVTVVAEKSKSSTNSNKS